MLSFLKPRHLTETVRVLAAVCKAEPDKLPILADALEDAGCPDELFQGLRGGRGLLTALRAGAADETRQAVYLLERSPDEHYREGFRQTLFVKCGVVGCVWTKAELAKRITRKRPRGSGSKAELAKRLEAKLNELADRRWARAIKGQRAPGPVQAAALRERLDAAVEFVNGAARERRMDAAGVIRVATRAAGGIGAYSANGGTVTANSYGYRWSTTSAIAKRTLAGTVVVVLERDGRSSPIEMTPKQWAAMAG